MKKITLAVLLGIFTFGCAFSQMSFNGSKLTKSAFALSTGSEDKSVKENTALDKKIVITNEEEEMARRRKKRRGGGGADFQLLSYSRIGATIPVGSLSDNWGTGYFGLGSIEGLIQNQFSVGITFGYYVYMGKTVEIDDGFGNIMTVQADPIAVIPLAGTFKYFFSTDDFKPYAGLDLGAAILAAPGFVSETRFGVTPRGGFIFIFGESYMVGFDASYNIVKDASGINIGLQLGYVFGN